MNKKKALLTISVSGLLFLAMTLIVACKGPLSGREKLSDTGIPENISSTNDRGSQDAEASIMFNGLKRTYLIHIPRNHDQSKPLPLVIVLHGGGGTGANVVKLTRGGFDILAEKEGVCCSLSGCC